MNFLWISQEGTLGDLAVRCAAALRQVPISTRTCPYGGVSPKSGQAGAGNHRVLCYHSPRPVLYAHESSELRQDSPCSVLRIEACGWNDAKLRDAIAATSADVLIFVCDFPSLWEVENLVGKLGLPGIVYTGAAGPIRDGSLLRGLRFVQKGVVPSEFLRGHLQGLANDQAWRSQSVGVDPKIFRPLKTRPALRRQAGLDEDFVVGCVARNREEEQLPTLLQAFKWFAVGKPNVKLVVHLEGIRNPKSRLSNPTGWDLHELIDRYELHGQIKLSPLSLTGGMEDALRQREYRLNRLYNLFDVFVVPGQGDGFGTTVLQAMAAGVPVVAMEYGLGLELVRNRGPLVKVAARWLASPHGEERAGMDEDHLVEQLRWLHEDEALRQRCRAKGRAFAESRSWDAIAPRWARTLTAFHLYSRPCSREAKDSRRQATGEGEPASRFPCSCKDRDASLPQDPSDNHSSSPRILIRRERGMGDLLFGLSVGARLKELHPEARIEVATLPAYGEWVRWFDCVDRVFTRQPDNLARYERVLDYEEIMDHAYAGDRAQGMGKQAGVEITRLLPPPKIPASYQRAARERLAAAREGRKGPVIGFAPLAVSGAPQRSLSHQQIEAMVAELLVDHKNMDATVILFCAQTIHGLDCRGLLDTTGQLTGAEAIALLDECDLVLGVDSGLLHAAAVLRKPVVGIFTHIPALHRLACAERFIAIQPSLPCFACGDVWPRGPHGIYPVCRHDYRGNAKEPPLSCVAIHRPEVSVKAVLELLHNPNQRTVINVDREGHTTHWLLPSLTEGAQAKTRERALTSLVILNHNTYEECTRECIRLALNNTVEPFEIVLVDNGSSLAECRHIQRDIEKSAQGPEREAWGRVRLVRSGKNLGYPRGVNRGLKEVSPEARYVCLLNSDCFLHEVRWNEKVAAMFDRDWRLGALCLTQGEHRYFLDGKTGQEYWFEEIESRGGDCEIINGSCIVVDRKKVGAFKMDERFSPGSREDDDLSFWIRSQGWSVGQCQELQVTHLRNQTLNKKGWKIRYEGKEYDYHKLLERNRRLLLNKWKPMLHPRLNVSESLKFLSRFYRPKVSIVLPTKDRLRTLGLTVASILGQELEEFELLIVVASREEAEALKQRYGKEPRVRVLTQSGEGIANARNTGMKAARGLYIAHMDDDEIWHPAHLKELSEFLDCNPSVGLVYGDVRKSRGRYLRGRYVEQEDLGAPWCQPFDYERFKTGNWIPASAAMHRTALLANVGYFDESFHYADDWEYWLRVARSHGVAHRCTLKELGFATVEYRIHGSNATLRDQELWRQDFERIEQQYGQEDRSPQITASDLEASARYHKQIPSSVTSNSASSQPPLRFHREETSPEESAKGRILVTDEEEQILTVMKAALTCEGYEVVTEHDGGRALAQLRERPFDLVFTAMPKPVARLTLLKEMTDLRPAAAVVLMTNGSGSEFMDQAISCGARMCLRKPFTMRQVLAVTRQLLSDGSVGQEEGTPILNH